MTLRLDDIRAVVTGSTRGLGRAFTEDLARRGASVVVNGTTPDGTDEAVERLRTLGFRAVGVAGSVADPEVCEALVKAAVDEFGGIDLLVNNAGNTADRSILKMTPEEFDRVVNVHLRGTWATSAAAARAMKSHGGAIVNVTSGAGLFGMFGQSNYSAAKAGIIGLTRVLHLELAKYGIRANALAPAARTDMTGVFQHGDVEHAVVFPEPEDVAPIVSYLASSGAAHIAGQVVSFDGTELSIWSHPEPSTTITHDSWNDADFAEALPESAMQAFHPDRWGSGVMN